MGDAEEESVGTGEGLEMGEAEALPLAEGKGEAVSTWAEGVGLRGVEEGKGVPVPQGVGSGDAVDKGGVPVALEHAETVVVGQAEGERERG